MHWLNNVNILQAKHRGRCVQQSVDSTWAYYFHLYAIVEFSHENEIAHGTQLIIPIVVATQRISRIEKSDTVLSHFFFHVILTLDNK